MKKELNSLITTLTLMLLAPTMLYSHASFSKRNKCRNSGKEYKASARVNGPMCKKQKASNNACSGNALAHETIYRQNTSSLEPICLCQSGINYWIGADAEAGSGPNIGFAKAWKTPDCRGYSAGNNTIKSSTISNSLVNGNVRSNVNSSIFEFNYTNNSITLKNLSGFLEINSLDFINEYASINIKVSIINNPVGDTNEFETVIFHSQAAIINGMLNISGDAGGFFYSDFNSQTLLHGAIYSLEGTDKIIQLNNTIDSSMTIEVELSVDVSNILEDESFVNPNMTFSLIPYPANNQLKINIQANSTEKGTLQIRNEQGEKNIINIPNILIDPKKGYYTTIPLNNNFIYNAPLVLIFWNDNKIPISVKTLSIK